MRVLRSFPAATTLLAAFALSFAATATASAPRTLVVSRLSLDAQSQWSLPHTPAVSTPRLRKGKLYVATVEGTVSYYAAIDYLDIQKPFSAFCGHPLAAAMFGSTGGVGMVGNDAQFIFAQPIETGTCAADTLPRVWLNFQSNEGFGWVHPTLLAARPITRPLASHTYSYAFIGQGKPLRFMLDDPDTRDDYGSLRIVVRRAVRSDCAGNEWRTFGKLKSRNQCLGSTAHTTGRIPTMPRVAPLRIPQTPIVHVVRDSDLPTSHNVEVPSGALTAPLFARIDLGAGAAGRRWATTLAGLGLRSAAISEFNGVALPAVSSTSSLFASAAGARRALLDELTQATRTAVPAGDSASTSADAMQPGATLVTYSATTPGASAGYAVISSTGTQVDSLREMGPMGTTVTAAQVESLALTTASR